ncbi:cytochrome c oxidase subunit 3 [Lewinella sp. LCG006]|uniref:cytochrome c oxidase subunit 3 n=1 Tax=Lewinella sp. LCG006 TaxID=3231911 RepID=UPI0034612BAA
MAEHDTTVMEHDVHHDQGGSWDGGTAPFQASYGKLMMWYFLLSDAFTFSGFLIAYGSLRFSSPTWPVPDFVFSTAPFGLHGAPLIFVTFMSFLLIISSVTMVRAVQEGHRENKRGVVFWMLLTVLGGAGFLGCQAWEWNNLIGTEHMSVTRNPFGTHTEEGVYLGVDGKPGEEEVAAGQTFLLHMADLDPSLSDEAVIASFSGHGEEEGHASHAVNAYDKDYGFMYVDEAGFIHRKYVVTEGENPGEIMMEDYGPKAFGALFFGITGFHGFHVLSGVVFLLIILINAGSGVYAARKNGYEMVEKIGLYWHFVDLVWVFVFLVFYLL